jgi:hypothetical protein
MDQRSGCTGRQSTGGSGAARHDGGAIESVRSRRDRRIELVVSVNLNLGAALGTQAGSIQP